MTLVHTTHQIWVPDENTEENIWFGDVDHGTAITGLPLCENTAQYRSFLSAMLEAHTTFESLSAIRSGLWPVLLMACRHFRLPVPRQLWLLDLSSEEAAENGNQSSEGI